MRCFIAAVALAAITACYAPPVESPQTHVVQETPIRVPGPQSKVDILFMVDNSLSMDAMQSELRARFGEFLSVFDALPGQGIFPDLHIGVVTSDYGAGDKSVTNGCDASPGGERGLLQAVGKAATGCSGPVGHPFIAYEYAAGGARHNLPAGQTLSQTFTCMATVGSRGCGFEHQLESVYSALNNHVENAGFVRDDALLAVVFVTNEDDGSAPPTTKIFENDPMYGAYDTYRQTRYGIACGSPLALPPYAPSGGPLAGCVPAPNVDGNHVGEEYDVSRYVSLFTQPVKLGGLKRNPRDDVILVGLDGPSDHVEIITARSSSGGGVAPDPAYVPCSPVDDRTCLVRVQHSCQNTAQPAFFADPAVRLHGVIAQSPLSFEASICGDDPTRPPDFSAVLTKVANQIVGGLLPGCIPAPLTNRDNPDCVVADVSVDDNGNDQVTSMPRCELAGGAFPCWRIEEKPLCKDSSPESVGVTIDRNGVQPPLGSFVRVFCSTVAQ